MTILQSRSSFASPGFLDGEAGNYHYQYHVLLFGLSSAPKVFTKTVVVVAAYLHLQGVTLFQYIDNWLLIASSQNLLRRHLALFIRLLESLGIAINYKKSNLRPLQHVQYIGAVLDSICAIAFLPADRASTIMALGHLLQIKPRTTVLTIQCLLGLMVVTIAVLPHSQLKTQLLQLWFLRNFKPLLNLQLKKLMISQKPLQTLWTSATTCWWVCHSALPPHH